MYLWQTTCTVDNTKLLHVYKKWITALAALPFLRGLSDPLVPLITEPHLKPALI